MRIPALQTEDVGDLSSRVHASPHKTATLPHSTLPEVTPCTSDCPSRSNSVGNRGFLLLWGQAPFFNALFKTVPKRTKHRSRRKHECSSCRWNLNLEACMSIHPLEVPLCASSGTLLLFQGTWPMTLSLPLVKTFAGYGQTHTWKDTLGHHTPLPPISLYNQTRGNCSLKQKWPPSSPRKGSSPTWHRITRQGSTARLRKDLSPGLMLTCPYPKSLSRSCC